MLAKMRFLQNICRIDTALGKTPERSGILTGGGNGISNRIYSRAIYWHIYRRGYDVITIRRRTKPSVIEGWQAVFSDAQHLPGGLI